MESKRDELKIKKKNRNFLTNSHTPNEYANIFREINEIKIQKKSVCLCTHQVNIKFL